MDCALELVIDPEHNRLEHWYPNVANRIELDVEGGQGVSNGRHTWVNGVSRPRGIEMCRFQRRKDVVPLPRRIVERLDSKPMSS